MDTSFYYKLGSRDQFFFTQFFGNDLEASFFDIHWFYVFKFNLHSLSLQCLLPESDIFFSYPDVFSVLLPGYHTVFP